MRGGRPRTCPICLSEICGIGPNGGKRGGRHAKKALAEHVEKEHRDYIDACQTAKKTGSRRPVNPRRIQQTPIQTSSIYEKPVLEPVDFTAKIVVDIPTYGFGRI